MATKTKLIKIEILENGVQAVSARELYQFLGGAKSQFARWSQKNITGNAFAIENEDYEGFDIMSNGNTCKDYVLTIDFAKKLSMLSRTERGEEARQYFLECERQLEIMQQDSYMIDDPVQRAQKWITEEQERQRLTALTQQQAATLAAAAPKLEYHDRVLQASSNSMNTREVAADYGMSAIRLNRILMDLDIQYKRGSRYYLYSKYAGKGYAESKTDTYDNGRKAKTSMKWTQAGREFIYMKLRGIGVSPVGYDDDDEVNAAELERLDAGIITSALH
jgi:anti-repressor protein